MGGATEVESRYARGYPACKLVGKIREDRPLKPQSTYAMFAVVLSCALFTSCSRKGSTVNAASLPQELPQTTVGVVPVTTHELSQHLTLSSELVPFQEIDVYAK